MFQELHVSLNTAHNSSQESLAHAFAVFHDPFPSASLVVKPLVVEDTYLLCPAPVLEEEGM